MDLQIYGRNLELNETTRDHISKKDARLGRHLAGLTAAKVELARENTRVQDLRVVAQITLDIDGTMLRGEERGANAIAAVDSAISVMDRRVERYKDKACRSGQSKRAARGSSTQPSEPLDVAGEVESGDEDTVGVTGKVVRVKQFPIKPMTVEDAAFQMELLGHDFFLFFNSEADAHNLLYRRHDGDYGLIQPEPL